MSVARLALISLLLFTTEVSSESQLAKCCPPGEVFSGRSKVECVLVPSGAMRLYIVHGNATVGFQGLPRCEEPEDIMTTPLDGLDSDNFLEVPACLEVLHEQINASTVIVVHCRSNRDRQGRVSNASFPQLAHVRKCCPYGTIFDRRTKACVSWLGNSESLLTFLPNELPHKDLVIIATEGPPKCKGTIVDYEIDADDIFLQNDTYSVMVPAFEDNIVAKDEFFVNKDDVCLEIMPDSVYNRRLIARVCRNVEFCERNACVRKCCAEDEFFYAEGCNRFITPEKPIEFHQALVNATDETSSSAFDTTKDYGVLIGKPCKYGMYPMDPKDEEWSLTSKGHVSAEGYQIFDHNEYCMDIFYNSSQFNQDFYLFICFDEPEAEKYVPMRYQVNTALEITSCIFLLMTLLVYACLPSLQNLHGKTLMCHVGSLFLAFTCLAIIPWIRPGNMLDEDRNVTTMCKLLGYIMLFCFLSSFFWLNVMCFDIWWTFGGLRGNTITRGHGHRRRFMLYCLYAWGLAFVVSSLAIVADYTDILPVYLQPDIGNLSCWFTQIPTSYGELTFFIGPITIQLLSNMVFFILTAVHCSKVKAEIKRVTMDPLDPRSKRFHSDRNRFVMNVKLFIVMGISWICEVLSFFLKKYFDYLYWQYAFFYISDVFNCLQGLLIFSLFVLKSRVYIALRKRFKLDPKKKSTYDMTMTVKDPHRVRKSASSSTLMSTFAISSVP